MLIINIFYDKKNLLYIKYNEKRIKIHIEYNIIKHINEDINSYFKTFITNINVK